MTFRQSIFQAREMLLDYYENKLDSSSHELVKKILVSDVETQRTLNQITKGLDFAEQLSKVKINENFAEQLRHAESVSSLLVHYAHFKNWNQAFRISSYAVSGCLVLVLLVMSLPRSVLLKLRHKSSQEVVLTQVMKPQDAALETDDPEKRDAQALLAQNLPTDTDEDEGGAADGQEASGDEHAEPIVIPSAQPQLLKINPKAAKAVAGSGPSSSGSSSNKSVGNDENEDANEQSGEKKTNGFVFRGTMKIDELDERTPIIAQQILELGGRKAGEVELGWRKDNKGSYYHFSIPEENYEKLVEYLHGFGPVRFSKDSHPRVMPPGQIRIILWVERANE